MVSHEVEAFLLIRTYPVMMGSDSTSAQTLETQILGLGQDFHDHVIALVVGRVWGSRKSIQHVHARKVRKSKRINSNSKQIR